MKISDWLGELCFYYEQKRKSQEKYDEYEFKALLDEHRDKINELEPSEYKDGLFKAGLRNYVLELYQNVSQKLYSIKYKPLGDTIKELLM